MSSKPGKPAIGFDTALELARIAGLYRDASRAQERAEELGTPIPRAMALRKEARDARREADRQYDEALEAAR